MMNISNTFGEMLFRSISLGALFGAMCLALAAEPANAQGNADAGADANAPNAIRVACIGDSITNGAGVSDRATKSYPALLEQWLGPKYEVRNFGANGSTILKKGNLPYWKRPQFQQAQAFKPDIAVVLFGANDSKHGSLDNPKIADNWQYKADFVGDYKALLAEFKHINPAVKLYVGLPVPAYPPYRLGVDGEVLEKEVIPLVRQVAAESDAEIIDLHSAVTDQKLFHDRVHPNDEGTRKMAETVYRALTGQDAPPAAEQTATNATITPTVNGVVMANGTEAAISKAETPNILQATAKAIATEPGAVKAEVSPQAYIAKFDGDRAAAISYTFDDGIRDQFTLAIPMLNEVGFKGTFFVIPNSTGATPEEGKTNDDKKRAWGGISWPELKIMADQGHEIASHTWSHRNMKSLSPEEVDAEFSKANDAIKTKLGKSPITLAFPFNASTPEVQAAALKYYVAYRAYQTATGAGTTVDSLNAWADKLVKDKGWGVTMTHAIAKGYAAMSDPEIFRKHLKYVKGREADIWVDTFANIARYEKERENATLKISGDPGHLTCNLNDTLDSQLYNVPLTIVLNAIGAKSARAERAGQPVPVRIDNGHIYLQAIPSPQPITITWTP